MNQDDRPRWDRGQVASALLVVVLAAACIALVIVTQKQGNPGTPTLTVEEAHRLVRQKNVAIGFLENGGKFPKTNMAKPRGLDEAERRFLEITQKLPGQRLGWQNSAICRYLKLHELKGGQKADATPALEAVRELRARHSDSAFAAWLSAQIHLWMVDHVPFEERQEQIDLAVDALRQAVQLESDNVWIRFSFAKAVEDFGIEAAADDAHRALTEAFELAPENIVVLLALLKSQALMRDPAFLPTIDKAKELLGIVRLQLQRRGEDLFQLLDESRQAAAEDRWQMAIAPLAHALNLTKPQEAYQSDQSWLKVHSANSSLDFVVFEFDDTFYQVYPPPPVAEPDAAEISFVEQNESSNIIGIRDVAVVDFDLDGNLDIALLRPSILEIYSAAKDAGEWTLLGSIEVPEGMTRLIAGEMRDLKEDKFWGKKDGSDDLTIAGSRDWKYGSDCHSHDIDFVVYGPDGLWVLENLWDEQTGARHLQRITQEPAFDELRDIQRAAFVDFDHDSDLDLVVVAADGVSLWASQGVGSMVYDNVTQWSETPPQERTFTQVVPVDWDRDVDLDVLLAGPGGPIGYLENQRHGTFRWRPLDSVLPAANSSQSFAVAEFDGNISWDVVSTGSKGLQVSTTSTPRAGSVISRGSVAVDEADWQHVDTWDYDNDGHLDLLAWSADRLGIFRGQSDGNFVDASRIAPEIEGDIVTCSPHDMDNDGDLDLVVATSSGVSIFTNEGGNQNNFFVVLAMGDKDNMGKGHHLGSLMEVKAGSHYQARIIEGQRVHFGLGKQKSVDVVRIVWSNGMPQDIIQPATRQFLCEIMTLKGSCPYLYTWNGERFEFYTDLLWAAPLGLQFADGTLAPARPWEYIKIDGERLQQRGGYYDLQITEELWEAAYFDKVQLIAVDHPEDVAIYSNEKVGPAEIAEHKIHTVRNPRRPIAAVDKHGRDVSQRVGVRDGKFAKLYDQRIRQGLVDEHYLELNLGPLNDPAQLTLFLTGWIMPTDTSLNVGLSQNPKLAGPRPPSVWFPDESGQWREVIPYMGFPGGKTKTIAVDLSKVVAARRFGAQDVRLRIVTSAEIYWDDVFFTTEQQRAELQVTPLEISSADLHFRGFSRRLPHLQREPEVYDYEQVATAPRWPPMRGSFTRYGDVQPLLTETDAKLVVIGSGDEITLRFQAPANEPPPGWRRDFILHGVGWDKDADLNTVHGQTVEPLPFVEMSRYPYPLDEPYPDTPEQRDYLKTYQTRRQDYLPFWNRVKRHSSN